ncbi:hypothetical protein [Streptomyces sp. NPDC018693]|uniref:hypothetical protein n=1 Tax=unclassified Streptomyces TaxID=2593676 RepID=UPI0037B7E895
MGANSSLDEAWAAVMGCLDQVEATARRVGYDRVEAVAALWGTKYLLLTRDDSSADPKVTTELDADLADHIALHEPARVIAQTAFMRDVALAPHRPVDGGCPMDGDDCPVIHAFLAL